MSDEKQNHERLRTSPGELGRELNSALAKYAAVEPRTGLEDRVLANLRAERERLPERESWRWGLAAALAGVLIVAGLSLKSGKPSPSSASNQPLRPTAASTQPGEQTMPNGAASVVRPRAAGSARTVTTHNHAPSAAAAKPDDEPRLDHFPSRQPLSAEELALARYVREFPQEATVIAQVQEEYQKEIQQMMKDERTETDGYGSYQQER